MSDRLALLEIFRSKARCAHTQFAAGSAWQRLHNHLDCSERSALSIAWSHITTGEGTPAKQELDEACKGIAERWTA